MLVSCTFMMISAALSASNKLKCDAASYLKQSEMRANRGGNSSGAWSTLLAELPCARVGTQLPSS
jgi:hypothetical protein